MTLVVYNYYQKIFGPAVPKEQVLFVPTETSLVEVSNRIGKITNSPKTFLWVAAKKKLYKPKGRKVCFKTGDV